MPSPDLVEPLNDCADALKALSRVERDIGGTYFNAESSHLLFHADSTTINVNGKPKHYNAAWRE